VSDFNDRIRDVAAREDRFIVAMTEEYRRQLARIVLTAQGRLVSYLADNLSQTDGVIDQTPGNLSILRGLDRRFYSIMREVGYEELNQSFATQFDGQLPFFQEIIQALSDEMKTPLTMPDWSARDLRTFSSMRLGAAASLNTVAETAGNNAMRQALFSFGALPFRTITDVLAREFTRSIGEAETLGATAMATYYRTVADRGYQIIEEDNPDWEIRYGYEGPLDVLTRPWCVKMVNRSRAGTTWKRAEIDAMAADSSRGRSQPSNVFTTCGGFNCRHQFYLAPRKQSEVT
jgi:hypothetical protein